MSVTELDQDFNYVDGTTLQTLTGTDAIAQNIENCMNLVPGESCVFPSAGVNYSNGIFRRADQSAASRFLRAKIAEIDGVETVNSVEIIPVGERKSRIAFAVTVDGDVIASEKPNAF